MFMRKNDAVETIMIEFDVTGIHMAMVCFLGEHVRKFI